MRRRSQSGITLIEMLVVMTLIAIVGAVAAPSVGSSIETVRLRSTAERLAATLRTARNRAVRTRHYMEVSVDPSSRAVELRDLESPAAVDAWEIPSTIQVKAEQRVAFLLYPDGGSQAIRLGFENARGREVEVALDPFTLFPVVKEVAR